MARTISTTGMLAFVLLLSLVAMSNLALAEQANELPNESVITDAKQSATMVKAVEPTSESEDTLLMGNTMSISNSKIIFAPLDDAGKVAMIVRMIHKSERGGKGDAALKRAIFRVLGTSRDDRAIRLLVDATINCRDHKDMLVLCTKGLVAAADRRNRTEPADWVFDTGLTDDEADEEGEGEAVVATRPLIARPPVAVRPTVVVGGRPIR